MALTTLFLVAGCLVMLLSNFMAMIHMATLFCVVLATALFGDLSVLPGLLLAFAARIPAPREM